MKFYVNGTKSKEVTLSNFAGITVPAGGKLYIGQDQDTHGGGFSAADAFMGSFSKLNLWDRVLSDAEVFSFSSGCSSVPSGNVLSWNNYLQDYEWSNAVFTDRVLPGV